MIPAFLCGLFYGALGLSAYRKAVRLRYLDQFLDQGLARLVADIKEEPCECGCERPKQKAWGYYKGELYPKPVANEEEIREAYACTTWVNSGTEDG